MDRIHFEVAVEKHSAEAVITEPVLELDELQLALVGGGIGDTVL